MEVLPDGEKKGVFQILHGMCEHKERYLPLMEFLSGHGFVCVCHDHRGHGDSVKTPDDLGYFYERSGNAVVQDAIQLTERIKTTYPNLPITLFGHSMGSMIARCFVQTADDKIDKLIVCGSPSQNPLAGVAVCLAKTIALFCGKRHRSKLLTYLSTGKGNERFVGEGKCAWLCKNRAVVQAYLADDKCRYSFTCNGFENLFKLMKRTYQKKRFRVQNPTMPIHFIAGGDDPVIVDELKWFKAIEAMREVGYESVSGKLYEGMRHEIHNETDQRKVFDDILAFANA